MKSQSLSATRREFLKSTLASSALLSLSGAVPLFLRQAAAAPSQQNSRVLVVVQLSGGNDGLNTVVPFRQEEYYKSRPKLGLAADSVLKINDELGLHPSLRGAADLLEQGKFAVVQGVGYAQPNRSHFESMDIWHTCLRKTDNRRDGWLGRYLDAAPDAGDLPAMHLGQEQQPLALAARTLRVPSIASVERFRLQDAKGAYERVKSLAETPRAEADELLGFVQSSTTTALSASQKLETVMRETRENSAYPKTALSEKLSTVAKLISAELPTRIYYVALDGFDTHSQQAAAHAGLLDQWSSALSAFYQDLAQTGHAERVLLFSFSEFGRRVQENASEGTDHGAAAPVFLAGPSVSPGVHGALPSLTDLDDGDIKFHTDFRRVYATILDRWFGANSADLLGERFEPLDFLKA